MLDLTLEIVGIIYSEHSSICCVIKQNFLPILLLLFHPLSHPFTQLNFPELNKLFDFKITCFVYCLPLSDLWQQVAVCVTDDVTDDVTGDVPMTSLMTSLVKVVYKNCCLPGRLPFNEASPQDGVLQASISRGRRLHGSLKSS